jgi:hypothetical protein
MGDSLTVAGIKKEACQFRFTHQSLCIPFVCATVGVSPFRDARDSSIRFLLTFVANQLFLNRFSSVLRLVSELSDPPIKEPIWGIFPSLIFKSST